MPLSGLCPQRCCVPAGSRPVLHAAPLGRLAPWPSCSGLYIYVFLVKSILVPLAGRSSVNMSLWFKVARLARACARHSVPRGGNRPFPAHSAPPLETWTSSTRRRCCTSRYCLGVSACRRGRCRERFGARAPRAAGCARAIIYGCVRGGGARAAARRALRSLESHAAVPGGCL